MYRRGLQRRPRLFLFSLLVTVLFLSSLEFTCRVLEQATGPRAALRTTAGPLREPDRVSAPMPADPDLGWRLQPGFRGQSTGVLVQHNALGLRSPETTLARPPGTVRILLLGDSTIYGHGVPAGATLRSQLEKLLAPRMQGRAVQVINAGVPGFSSEQSLRLLQTLGVQLSPDFVVIASLFCDAEIAPRTDRELLAATRQTLEHRPGTPAPNAKTVQPHTVDSSRWGKADRAPWAVWMARRLVEHSALARTGYRLAMALDPRGNAVAPWVHSPGGMSLSAGVPRVPLADYRHNLEEMVRVTRQMGAVPVLLLLAPRAYLEAPNPEDSSEAGLEENAGPASRRDARAETRAGDPVASYRRVMREVAREQAVSLVDMEPVLRDLLRSRRVPSLEALFMDEVHPTPAGHLAMARALADILVQATPASASDTRFPAR